MRGKYEEAETRRAISNSTTNSNMPYNIVEDIQIGRVGKAVTELPASLVHPQLHTALSPTSVKLDDKIVILEAQTSIQHSHDSCCTRTLRNRPKRR